MGSQFTITIILEIGSNLMYQVLMSMSQGFDLEQKLPMDVRADLNVDRSIIVRYTFREILVVRTDLLMKF